MQSFAEITLTFKMKHLKLQQLEIIKGMMNKRKISNVEEKKSTLHNQLCISDTRYKLHTLIAASGYNLICKMTIFNPHSYI
jgi:hypothetical protein